MEVLDIKIFSYFRIFELIKIKITPINVMIMAIIRADDAGLNWRICDKASCVNFIMKSLHANAIMNPMAAAIASLDCFFSSFLKFDFISY